MSVRQVKVHGRKVWQARVAFQGLRSSRICASKEAARTAESELLQDLKKRAGQAEQAGLAPATLRQLFDAYAEDLENRGKGEETIARAVQTCAVLEALLPELLAKPVSRITPAKSATINRDLRTLRAMLKRVRPDFRFPGGAFFAEDETRVRWLRPEEELLVLETMAEPFRTIAKLAALTLMRLSEIRLLRREMVHLEQGVILLPRAKGGVRSVMLSGQAQKLLRGQLEGQAGEWVFPNAAGRPFTRNLVSKKFRRAVRGVGLRDFHFHDLRHDGATRALNAGVTAPILMQLGGWKTEKMMRRYAAVTDASLRKAAEAVAGNETWQPRRNPAPIKMTG